MYVLSRNLNYILNIGLACLLKRVRCVRASITILQAFVLSIDYRIFVVLLV